MSQNLYHYKHHCVLTNGSFTTDQRVLWYSDTQKRKSIRIILQLPVFVLSLNEQLWYCEYWSLSFSPLNTAVYQLWFCKHFSLQTFNLSKVFLLWNVKTKIRKSPQICFFVSYLFRGMECWMRLAQSMFLYKQWNLEKWNPDLKMKSK